MQNVLILGATSAIAAEVARLYAERGDRLHLIGRSSEKLASVVEQCRGGEVTSHAADFAHVEDNEALIRQALTTLGSVDVVLIAHGDLGDQLATERSFAQAEAMLRVNFLSVVSLLIPLANHMEAAGTGRIAVITSVAGDRGRPRNYTYGTAKGALNLYLQGLRTRLYRAGVRVITLKLGPVDTPMTRHHNKHFLFGKVPGVARDIVRAIDRRKPVIYSPPVWRWIMVLVRWAPEWVVQKLAFLSGR